MESYRIENVSFTYPDREEKALDGVSLTVGQGEWVTICGHSGCGKTTLLRLLKTVLAPYGKTEGNIVFDGKPLKAWDTARQAGKIGFVMQNPDNQIVTDKVWHELAFGLESLGMSSSEIRTRVSEMASFFGMQNWFYKNVTELSGGQKQILNVASIMVMQPSVLLLDEPTSQLDPIAASEFLKTLEKINRELGTTILLSEHRLEEAFPLSDRVVVMEKGRIIADAPPEKIGSCLPENHAMVSALPAQMRIYKAVEGGEAYPKTVREGRLWLENFAASHPVRPERIPKRERRTMAEEAISLHDVWFRYERNMPDVIKGINLQVKTGELLAIVGGNGTGKTTALSLMSGLYTPQRGDVRIFGEKLSGIRNLYDGILGVLPQSPQALFVKKTVQDDLMEMLSDVKLSREEKEKRVWDMAVMCRIEGLLKNHPYDLSGGEMQRAAMAKVLLKMPKILLLDEPTKGMDSEFKTIFAEILQDLQGEGVTIVMVSHDIEFCAAYADRCAMFFDGGITSLDTPEVFFAGKNFYTTAANRMARTLLPTAVLTEDVIRACGKDVEKKKRTPVPSVKKQAEKQTEPISEKKKGKKKRLFFGSICILLFCMVTICRDTIQMPFHIPEILQVLTMAGALGCFLPKREYGVEVVQQPVSRRKLARRTAVAAMLILILIPFTIFAGVFYLGDRKYYFISLLVILETMIPFCMVFEKRKPAARELVIISVLCALAVAGRTAFMAFPQFKPALAVVLLAGVCFGGETGFLVGAVTGFVSNFFFGQGPWTPWQMFAFGIVGFLAGVLFRKGWLRKTRTSLCLFGAFSALVIYGGIINPASLIMMGIRPTGSALLASYAAGLPFDLVHAASTAFFLWFLAEPMIDKLERIKVKYGLIEKRL